ncbi:MAG: universal stress protein [Chloroflexi bacterium]|nr:universal stress protein [Chloroflexota bacterium]
MISKIMVPVNPASVSNPAFELATETAKAFGAAILLATVVKDLGAVGSGDMSPAQGDDVVTGTGIGRQTGVRSVHDTSTTPSHEGAIAEQQLQSLAKQLRHEIDVVDTVVASGDAADSLVDIAHREGVGLIVMATHGRTGIARGVLGSVTDVVIRHAEVPVLVVRG